MLLLLIVRIVICLAFYIIGAYATTDILRLLKNNPVQVNNSDCFCEHCGCRLSARDQIPIFAFLWNRGRCRQCKNRIPIGNFILEVLFTSCFILLSIATDFAPVTWPCCILFYETVKFFCVWRWGKRGKMLVTGLCQSIIGNLVNFTLVAILFFMHWYIVMNI